MLSVSCLGRVSVFRHFSDVQPRRWFAPRFGTFFSVCLEINRSSCCPLPSTPDSTLTHRSSYRFSQKLRLIGSLPTAPANGLSGIAGTHSFPRPDAVSLCPRVSFDHDTPKLPSLKRTKKNQKRKQKERKKNATPLRHRCRQVATGVILKN